MQKTSFILFNNYKEYFDLLNNEEAGELIKAILNYSNGNKIEKLSIRVECFFVVIKQNLDKQAEEYNKVCEKNKANVTKRWEKQKQKENMTAENKNTKNTTVYGGKNGNAKNTKNTDNDNDNDKDKDNNIKKETTLKGSIEKKQENSQAETAQPDSTPKVEQIELLPDPQTEKPKKLNKPRKVTPQEIIVKYFAEKYKQLTGIDYLAVEKDYSIVGKNLTSKYDIELIKRKIDWLEIGCTHFGVYWFAKDINAFTINKLIDKWNEILPVLTDEQKKQQAKRKKEEETKAKVMAELAKQGIKIAETAQNSTEVGHVRV